MNTWTVRRWEEPDVVRWGGRQMWGTGRTHIQVDRTEHHSTAPQSPLLSYLSPSDVLSTSHWTTGPIFVVAQWEKCHTMATSPLCTFMLWVACHWHLVESIWLKRLSLVFYSVRELKRQNTGVMHTLQKLTTQPNTNRLLVAKTTMDVVTGDTTKWWARLHGTHLLKLKLLNSATCGHNT